MQLICAGSQERNIVCMKNSGSEDEVEAAEGNCSSESKPEESQACNTFTCVERDISLQGLEQTGLIAAGTDLIIKWQGGKLYGKVKLEVRQAGTSVDEPPTLSEEESGWEQDAYGLPTGLIDNTGNFTWPIPSSIASGKYFVRLTSGTDDANVDVSEDPLAIQAQRLYILLAIPASPGTASSTLTGLQ
eukprot:scaffold280986_cov19-Tisochrysis_lutea.AAC.1